MRIDVHAHVWSEAYLNLLASFGSKSTAVHREIGAGTTQEDLDSRFALMASAGVEMQVLSVTPASPHFVREQDAIEAARAANDEYAELVRRFPDRFRAYAALPLPHIEAALVELDRALDELGMIGAAITTSILGRSIADAAFAPLYAELDRRRAILYVHPAGCGACSPLIADHHLTWSIGAPIEDTVAAMHLILAGIPKTYPEMKIILSHLGGALPMVLERVDHQYGWEAPDTPEKPSIAARRMWYDTVGHNHVPALRAAAETFGADRLLLGTDFPYQTDDLFRAAIDYVKRAGLPQDEVAAILDRNAVRLLGLDV